LGLKDNEFFLILRLVDFIFGINLLVNILQNFLNAGIKLALHVNYITLSELERYKLHK